MDKLKTCTSLNVPLTTCNFLCHSHWTTIPCIIYLDTMQHPLLSSFYQLYIFYYITFALLFGIIKIISHWISEKLFILNLWSSVFWSKNIEKVVLVLCVKRYSLWFDVIGDTNFFHINKHNNVDNDLFLILNYKLGSLVHFWRLPNKSRNKICLAEIFLLM